jgi:hypothetical protein
MKSRNLILLLTFLMTACGQGGGSGTDAAPTGSIAVQCVNATNNSADNCSATATAAISIQGGNVSRSQPIWFSGAFANGTAGTFAGYYEIHQSPGCNGENDVVVVSGNVFLDSLESINPAASRQCASMPTGPANMRLLLYSGPSQTICTPPPGQICTTLPNGQISCVPADDCVTTATGPQIDNGIANFTVVP